MRKFLRLIWTSLLICACAVVLAPFSYRVEAATVAPFDNASCNYGMSPAFDTTVTSGTQVRVGFRCFINPAMSGFSTFASNVAASTTHNVSFLPGAVNSGSSCANTYGSFDLGTYTIAAAGLSFRHGDLRDSGGTVLTPANAGGYPVNYMEIIATFTYSGSTFRWCGMRSMGYDGSTGGWWQFRRTSDASGPTRATSYSGVDFVGLSGPYFDTDPDDFEGGFLPPDDCSELDFDVIVNGTTVLTSVAAIVADGDEITVETTTGWLDDSARVLSYRWFSGSPSHVPFPLTLDGVYDFSDTLPSTTGYADVSQLQVRCVDASGDWYWTLAEPVLECAGAGGNLVNGWCDVQWQGGNLCTSLVLFWADAVDLELGAGDTFELPYRFPAGIYATDVVSLDANWLKVVETYASAVEVLDVNGNDVHTVDDLIPRDTDKRQGTIVFEVVDPLPDGLESIVVGDDIDTVRCNGQFNMPGPSQAGLLGTIVDDDDPSSIAACLNGNRPGLNPSSWVPALVGMQVCTFRYLVIPPGDDLEAWVIDARDAMEETPPFSFAILLVDFGDGIVDAFNDPSGSGCFDVAIPAAGTPAGDVCVGDGIALSGGQRNLIALIIAVPLYLGLIGHGFGLLRR